MPVQKVNFRDIAPKVRYSKTLILPYDFSVSSVHAYDARLIYFYSGAAKVRLDDKTYNATRGSLFLWQSQTKYSITNTADADTKMMMINFDFFARPDTPDAPIPTVPDRSWHPSDALESVFFEDVPQLNLPVHLEGMQHMERVFGDMTDEFIAPKLYDDLMLRNLLLRALVGIVRRLVLGDGQRMTGLVERVIDFIQENYAADLSNEAIGRHFSYHPNYINRVIQKHTGQSLHQYVLSCRVAKALEMLQTTNLSVTEVSERVGFSSIKHFSQTFKSIYGYSPIHFRD